MFEILNGIFETSHVAIILICGLMADNMLNKDKIKKRTERIKDLEKAIGKN